MNKVQMRMGYLFTIFSSVLLIVKLYHCITIRSFTSFFVYWGILYCLCPLLFGITILWNHTGGRILQLGMLLIVGCISLVTTSTNPFWGLSIITITILIMYAYGWLSFKHKIRIVITILGLVILFSVVSLAKWIYVVEWTLFIVGFIAIFAIIFKDSIEKLEQKDTLELTKCITIIKEATKAARDSMDIATTAVDMLAKFEDSVKKGEPNGK